MAEQMDTSTVGKISTRLKTVVGACAGIFSGAVMMYLSPLLDKVVKPARPVANFSVEVSGATVTLHNRSLGSGEGWWDFGDGTPLEPASFKQESVTHTYASSGSYMARLNLRNLIGEESERTVNVRLDHSRSESPAILGLDAVSVSLGAYAPATFRVVSKAKNARLCVWDLGDDRPLEISTDSPNNQERLVSFSKPGGYMIKLAAVAGRRATEKSTIVYVDEPPPGMITAILNVTDQATHLERDESSVPITASFPPKHDDTVYRFDQQVPARQGFEITAARIESGNNDPHARNLNLQVAADRRSVHLTGEMVREKGLLRKGPLPPNLLVHVALTQECRTPVSRPAVPVTSALAVPGAVTLPLPPLPADWIEPNRQLRIELRDGDRVIWRESQLPRGKVVATRDKSCTFNTLVIGEQVRVELTEVKGSPKPPAN